MRSLSIVGQRPAWFGKVGRIGRALAKVFASNGKMRRIPLAPIKYWTRYRDLDSPPELSFREQWKEQNSK
jgi:hypothetical protein